MRAPFRKRRPPVSKSKPKTARKPRKNRPSAPRLINPNTAGIDVGAEECFVAVPPDRDPQPVRHFLCFTEDLHALARWLKTCGITSVAMESTGVYWIPVCQILETYGLEICLVNARHVKNLPGRKSDVQDCQWLQQLHSYGLLAASFRPSDQICVLRSYWRHRARLIQYAGAHIQHLQKALVQMNLQLHRVVSDVTGVTGLRIIRAILAGQRDPQELAALRDFRIKASAQTIAKALVGDYRSEHLFALRHALELYDFYSAKIKECDREVEAYLGTIDSRVDPIVTPMPPSTRTNKSKKPQGNQAIFDLRTEVYRISGVDFTQLEGFDALTVQTVLSEVGLDPSRFPTCKRFTSWLCLCPDNRITGGRIKSSRTRPSANRAARAFGLAAQSLSHSQGPLGSCYRRLKSRLGAPKAITAMAHKLARIFYRLWSDPAAYNPQWLFYYEKKNEERTLRYLQKKARSMGYDLVERAASGTHVTTEVS